MTPATGQDSAARLQLPFTHVSLDRAAELRGDPAQVADLLQRDGAVALVAGAEGVLLDRSERPVLVRQPLGSAGAGLIDPDGPLLLGLVDGSAVFATDLDRVDEPMRQNLMAAGELVSLRDAGTVLDSAEGGLAAYMTALLNWHRRHGFCANCGAPTAIGDAGLMRVCSTCHSTHFPRIDPVVIMLVEFDGRLLLGRRNGWPGARYSLLAGFVAAGETPEDAVIREVREEAGIAAYAPRYVTAQPWPFPSSLMLGFEATSDGGDPVAADGELSGVGWFTRAQIRAAESGTGEIELPAPITIARMLIDRWVAREA